MHVRARDQFGEHAGGLFKQRAAQRRLRAAEALGNAGQIPHRVDGDLGDRDAAVGVHEVAVGFEPAGRNRALHFMQVEPRLGDGDGRANVDAFGDFFLERVRRQMPPRIERHDPARLAPLRERADAHGRMGVGEVGPADRIESAGGNRERPIERVGAAMAADGVAIALAATPCR